ncbi:ABC transporter permease [Tepidiforma sp.]|uniref:ABC transporter permease n=1 Tax=Tepidiforma sp. TaxID=2682230 RepID=UPI002ADD596F|nr:ABC transporter permease [Tepidiforma sp.]
MSAAAAAEPIPLEVGLPTPRRRFLRQLLRKRLAVLAIVYLAIFYTCGIFAPLIAPHDPYQQNLVPGATRQGPSAEHWLGTDALGRDLASRVIYAARTTVIFTVVVLISGSLVLGLGLGLLAGYRGGWVDTLIMRTGEVLAGLPTLLLMLAITAAFRTRLNDIAFWLQDNTPLGTDARTFVKFAIIVFATVPFAWIGTSRIVRSQALAIREETYVLAAEAMGASTWRIITRHILPGVLPLFVVGVSAGMGATAGAEVTLSFLGLGIDPPTASFGSLIAAGAGPQTLERYPHLLLAPAIPVTLFFFAWNLLGDALVDLLEPRTQLTR